MYRIFAALAMHLCSHCLLPLKKEVDDLGKDSDGSEAVPRTIGSIPSNPESSRSKATVGVPSIPNLNPKPYGEFRPFQNHTGMIFQTKP
jgi:hypothetical protein